MGWKMWEINCPCCSGCTVDYTLGTCNCAFPTWGNLLPDGLINPSSISVFLANCTKTTFQGPHSCDTCSSITGPVGNIFYPLLDPSQSGKHTFKYSPGEAGVIAIVYETGVFLGPTHTYQFLIDSNCNSLCKFTYSSLVPALQKYDIWKCCVWDSIKLGGVRHYTYTCPGSAAALAAYNNTLPYQYVLVNFGGGLQCELSYCSSISGINTIFSKTGPINSEYYKLFTNNSVLNFKVTNSSPIQFGSNFYSSDAQLMYSYVVYYPSGEAFPCMAFGGASLCLPYHTNVAIAYYQYVLVLDSDPGAIQCSFTGQNVYPVDIPGIQQPVNQKYPAIQPGFGFCNLPIGFAGATAFQDAENFVQNLPQTIQHGDYGFVGGDPGGVNPVESFLLNSVSGDCSSLKWSNPHILLSNCDGSIIFSGYHTLTMRPA